MRFGDWIDTHPRVKCNCGHYPKDHYGGGGQCKCGCTWYYPNDKYILRKTKHENKTKSRK